MSADELMLLCILIFLDAVETAKRTDLLDRLSVIRSEAEGIDELRPLWTRCAAGRL